MIRTNERARSWARAAHLGSLSTGDRVRQRAVRAHRAADNNVCHRLTNARGNTATLDLYGDLGFWDGCTAADFGRQLKAITAPSLTINISSPGGDVFDGIAIYDLLCAHPATKHVVVHGIAASAAALVAMAGTTVTVMPGAMMMVQDASGGCIGNAAEMTAMADLLDKVSDDIASIYAARSRTGTVSQWRTVMRAETWYFADEAVTAGLADRVGDTEAPTSAPVNTARWNLAHYNYAGRTAAPAPRPMAAAGWDASAFRQALKEGKEGVGR